MNFLDLLMAAKNGNGECTEQILDMYSPLLFKEAMIDGILDEDLLQEFRIIFLSCIKKFKIYR